jgi:hypothetical protein
MGKPLMDTEKQRSIRLLMNFGLTFQKMGWLCPTEAKLVQRLVGCIGGIWKPIAKNFACVKEGGKLIRSASTTIGHGRMEWGSQVY